MKTLMFGLLVMALLPIALIVGCNDNNPNSPGSGSKVGNGTGGSGSSTTTPSPTPNIPLGLWVTANFQRSIVDGSLLGNSPTTIISTTLNLSINHTAESTDAVTLNTPIDGAIVLPFTQITTQSGIPVAQYSSSVPFNYVPNGNYTMAVSTSIGAVISTLSAPGSVAFYSTGASVTALYPGNFDSAQVERYLPLPVTITYQSLANVSVGSPYTYPATAFSSPATFYNGYTASEAMTFASPAAAGSSFVASDSLNEYFAR